MLIPGVASLRKYNHYLPSSLTALPMIQRYRTFTTGHFGFIAAFLLTVLMTATEIFFGNPYPKSGVLGICLPSPNHWVLSIPLSASINLALILLCGIAMQFLNKKYGFIKSTDTVAAVTFFIFCGSNTWIDGLLNSSVMICAINLIALFMIFHEYRSQKSMQTLFIIATLLSIGSMFQYALVFFIPAYILIAMMLKTLNLKSFSAFILGIAAPYWIGIGLGLLPLDSFQFPIFSNIFDDAESRSVLLMGLLNLGLTALLGISLTLYNAVKIYAGNTRRRVMNNATLIVGFTSIVCMLFDIYNIHSYIVTLYMAVAFQVANFFDLHNIRRPSFWFITLLVLYIASFLLMETGIHIYFNT